ncbi:Dos2-interacting transcription regulator of RNA-Pol-II-domain-containing protein [Thamnidium elegans]|nr:Dos2-interacting transcription regulator of RNA-Pol-II-domain-containing protein [Thamnidium elegans]
MSSSSIEKNVTDYMISDNESSNAIKAVENIMDLINDQPDVKTNLLNLIQSMGEYLVNEDDTIRSKSTNLLSHAISNCDQSKLTEETVGVLVNFYANRLSDHASVPNLMTGFVALTSKFDHFNTACTMKTIESIIKQVKVQVFPHITRNATFQVYENLLDYHCQDVKLVNDQFIRGFTRSIAGEKDPRNLMAVYTIIQKIVQLLDISTHVEDLFDATFCYFPITFRPPPDNPFGITAKDLKSNLRKCMASTPLFSKLALPLLLQKLTTTAGSAKKDSLETIIACAPVYPANELIPIAGKLYDAIKVEIVNESADPVLREPSLDAINVLTKALTGRDTLSENNVDVAQVMKPLIDDCVSLLEELDESTVKPASLVLRSAASGSPLAYSLIETKIIPMLLRQYRDNQEIAERYLILCTMVAIIQARKIVFGPSTGDDKDVDLSHNSVLISYKDRLIDIFSSAVRISNEHPEVRLMGILGLGLLCVLKGYMKRDERGVCIQTLNSVLETEEEDKLRMSVEMSLSEICTFDPELVAHITIPVLIKLLPDFTSSSDKKSTKNYVSYKLTLKTIQKLCTSPTLYEAMEQELLKKFLLICGHNEDKKYAVETISTLLNLIKAKGTAKHADLKSCADTLLPKLFHSIITASLDETADKKKTIIVSDEVLQIIYLIITNVMKNMNTFEQQEYVIQMFKLFKENDLKVLQIESDAKFCPLSSDAPECQAVCTQIFSTIISTLRKDVALPIESTESFLDYLVAESLKSSNEAQIASLSRITASIINKWKDDDSFKAYLSTLVTRLEDMVRAKSLSALLVYIWVAKGLVTRSHKKGLEMTETIISWIPDPVFGKESSSGFDVLIGDDPLCLNKQCFATVSFLHKQKFMAFSLPKLLYNFNSAQEEGEKLNYLIAIAYLLKNVPKSILIDELPPLVPLLIRSLSFPDAVLKLSTLELFEFALSEVTNVMAQHISTLLPAFILLIGPQEGSMKVRILALKCIELVCKNISRDIVLPHVRDTLKAIAVPLDDKKRLVRKQAVECRETWYLIDQKK